MRIHYLIMRTSLLLAFMLICGFSAQIMTADITLNSNPPPLLANSFFPGNLTITFHNFAPSGVAGTWSLGPCGGSYQVAGESSQVVESMCTIPLGEHDYELQAIEAGGFSMPARIVSEGIRIDGINATSFPGNMTVQLDLYHDGSSGIIVKCSPDCDPSKVSCPNVQSNDTQASGPFHIEFIFPGNYCTADHKVFCHALLSNGIKVSSQVDVRRSESCCADGHWSADPGTCDKLCGADPACQGRKLGQLPCRKNCTKRPETFSTKLVLSQDFYEACTAKPDEKYLADLSNLTSCSMYYLLLMPEIDCKPNCNITINAIRYIAYPVCEYEDIVCVNQTICIPHAVYTVLKPEPAYLFVNVSNNMTSMSKNLTLSVPSPYPCKREQEACRPGECNNLEKPLLCVNNRCENQCQWTTAFGLCDKRCGADSACHGTRPGTDFPSFTCTSVCRTTDEKIGLEVNASRCSKSVFGCIPMAGNILEIAKGNKLLLDFSISLRGPLESHVVAKLDGKNFYQNLTSGGSIWLELDEGFHILDFSATHPDYLDNSKQFQITVLPVTPMFADISPKILAARINETKNFTLLAQNLHELPLGINLTSNLPTDLPASLSLNPKESRFINFRVRFPPEEGEYNLTVAALSEMGNATASSLLKVGSREIFDFHFEPLMDDDILKVRLTNNGTIIDEFNISTCLLEKKVVINPSESRTITLGVINEACPICVSSKAGKRCASANPVRIDFLSNSSFECLAGQESDYDFAIIASMRGNILVRPRNTTWFTQFSCNATCAKKLTFTPLEPSNFVVEFELYWPEQNMYMTKKVRFIVSESPVDLSIDRNQLEEKTRSLKIRMEGLELRGITSPAAKKILEEVESADPKSLEELAQVKGKLDGAERYINYAKQTQIPERSVAWGHLLLGILALLIAVIILLSVFRHRGPEYYTAGFDWRDVTIPLQLKKK